MSSQRHTPNYGLTQYSVNGTDKLSFSGDYNSDMKIIDEQLYAINTRLTNIETQLTNLLANGAKNA